MQQFSLFSIFQKKNGKKKKDSIKEKKTCDLVAGQGKTMSLFLHFQ